MATRMRGEAMLEPGEVEILEEDFEDRDGERLQLPFFAPVKSDESAAFARFTAGVSATPATLEEEKTPPDGWVIPRREKQRLIRSQFDF